MDTLLFRNAQRTDLPVMIGLLADDPLGSTREALLDPLPPAYVAAFEEIERDPRNALVVVEDVGTVVGMLQLTFIPGLTYQGGERAQIEGVRVAASHRGRGVGRQLIEWAAERARGRGCRLVQFTTDKRRSDAHRCYESLGFVASHVGMKHGCSVQRLLSQTLLHSAIHNVVSAKARAKRSSSRRKRSGLVPRSIASQ
ncbi:MAG TPA: GNAT family N-acetyltransferase [Thermomicrobiales bacterium]|nr:GNAT family N-acetyltransferase [Thermomicrobiales bacterium]